MDGLILDIIMLYVGMALLRKVVQFIGLALIVTVIIVIVLVYAMWADWIKTERLKTLERMHRKSR